MKTYQIPFEAGQRVFFMYGNKVRERPIERVTITTSAPCYVNGQPESCGFESVTYSFRLSSKGSVLRDGNRSWVDFTGDSLVATKGELLASL